MATLPILAMIPAGYKAGKLYTQLPVDGGGDGTVTRGSSATRVNSNGLIETVGNDIPRLDYLGGGCPVLLAEPQSTNLCLTSEDFSNVNWSKLRSSIISDQAISPNGSLSSDKLVEDSSTGTHYIEDVVSITSGQEYVFSVFAKAAERSFIQLRSSSSGSWGIRATFDLSNGVPSNVEFGTASIVDYGNGWYRCIIQAQANATTVIGAQIRLDLDGSTTSYLGDGSSGVYIFGAQIENLSYPTTYIPTTGTLETRLEDSFTDFGSANEINSVEGVLMVEFQSLTNNDTQDFRVVSLSDGTNNNTIWIGFRRDTGYIYFFVVKDGINQSTHITSITSSDSFSKVALRYKQNDFALYVNGVNIFSDNSGDTYSTGTLDRFSFNRGNGINKFVGKVKKVLVFSEALTDQELQSLTTP